jgi:DNA-binding response OmpR family regulator
MLRDENILIIDDDENIAGLIALYLNKEGYETTECYSGIEGLKKFNDGQFDLIVLDVMLPQMDGYEVLRELRKNSKVPVIMLTAKGETIDKVLGLELGADDYLVKPFEPKELVACVKAVSRRYSTVVEETPSNVLKFPNLVINMDDFNITYFNERVELPPKELELLYYLANNPNRVFTRDQLLDKIWGYEYIGETRTVDVHVKRLREKLNREGNGWEIKTVWGVGYKFSLD